MIIEIINLTINLLLLIVNRAGHWIIYFSFSIKINIKYISWVEKKKKRLTIIVKTMLFNACIVLWLLLHLIINIYY